jgi:hypothetical protein
METWEVGKLIKIKIMIMIKKNSAIKEFGGD